MTLPWSPALCALLALAVSCFFLLFVSVWARYQLSSSRHASRRDHLLKNAGLDSTKARIAGFFHPYCNAGGGGERVLWTAIATLQRDEQQCLCVVYTGDQVSKLEITNKVQNRFDIVLDASKLHIINLSKRFLVEDATWPRFTLLGQSLGSIILAWEALSALTPDDFIDTMGYAFTYPLAKWAGLNVASYTHYPTISTDMLRRVESRQAGHSNSSAVARSFLKSEAKMLYYTLFMSLYSWCLAQADVIMANSTWTYQHLRHILGQSQQSPLSILYPPCDVRSFSALPLDTPRTNNFLSVAQFRPEKEHHVQIKALSLLLQRSASTTPPLHAKLVLAGSVRNEGDARRVEGLRQLAKELKVEDAVEFVVNAPYRELLRQFGQATAGLSTMVDEHFGINVVELMAAGVIPVAHPSAGPLLDIVVPFEGQATGFHASTPQEFADQMLKVTQMSHSELLNMRQIARTSVLERFSVHTFEHGWMKNWHLLHTDHFKTT